MFMDWNTMSIGRKIWTVIETILFCAVLIFMFLGLVQLGYYFLNDPFEYGQEICSTFLMEASCGIFWAVLFGICKIYFKAVELL